MMIQCDMQFMWWTPKAKVNDDILCHVGKKILTLGLFDEIYLGMITICEET